MSALRVKGDASIVLCGAAGQGIQTVEHLLTRILKQAGYHVFSSSEFMSRIRGGSNSTEIRISSRPISAARGAAPAWPRGSASPRRRASATRPSAC